MSHEFVPGKGLVPTNPTGGRAAPRLPGAESTPYWSPASKISGQRADPEPSPWGYDPAQESPQEEYEEEIDWGIVGSTLPAPPKRSLQTVGIPEPIRQHFRSLDIAALKQMPPDDDRYQEIPSRFAAALPLDDPKSNRRAGGSFGYASAVYRVTDNSDSNLYALRRFDNVRTTPPIVQNALSKWLPVRHPAIVSLYSIHADKGCLFFTHAYHPAAETLKQKFIDQRGAPLAEALLWRILTQLLAGVRAAHSHGVAIRAIGLTRILMVSGTKVRINSVGVPDVIEFESRRGLSDLQGDDIVKLGIVLLSLAARTVVNPNLINQAMAMVQTQYSPSFHQILDVLLSGKYNKIAAVCSAVPTERWCDELDLSLAASDGLHSHLRSEYECSRVLRLLLKLGMINERPEKTLAGAQDWSETGDRYILKLFRDFLFHQTQLDGTVPSLDAGHIIASLNKLEMSDPEKILLCSRNNKDLLVVSFADVHRCLEEAFGELVRITEQARAAAADARRGGGGGYGMPPQMNAFGNRGPMGGMEAATRTYHGHPDMNMGYAPGGYGDQGGVDNYYYEPQGGGPGGHPASVYDSPGYQEAYQDRGYPDGGYHPPHAGRYGHGGGYQGHRR